MSLRPFSIGCAGILLLLGAWAAFGTYRSARKRQWRGIFYGLVALCLFALAAAPVSYLAGFDTPHAVHNKPAPVPDSAITYYAWSWGGATANSSSQLFAVRARTGAIIWQRPLAVYSGSLELDGDRIYGISPDSSSVWQVVALDAATGTTRWQHPVTGSPTYRGLRLVGDTLLVGVDTYSAPDYSVPTPVGGVNQTAEIVALRPSDGQELWRVSLGSTNTNVVAITGGTNVFYDFAGGSKVEARSLSDGHQLWTNTVTNGIALAGPDPLVAASYDGAVTALSATDGATRWSFGDHLTLNPVALFVAAQRSDSQNYASDNPEIVYALDAATGALRWQFPTHSPAPVRLLASGDTVYVVGGGGLYALRALDGTVRWHAGSGDGWTLTSLVGSTLYVTHTVTLLPDDLIGIVFPKQQLYISAVDTSDGSLC